MKRRSPATASGTSAHWWTDAVGYQVYLRSFADSDDDGVGDLGGVIEKLDYLKRLGVDFVWITPFYPSPGHDWGYDVADYRNVDPLFGDLETFDHLVAEMHGRDIRIVTDLVPNHTSSNHRWFQAALGNSGAADRERYRDHYIWRDPAPGGGPPNNWVSYFGGSAWTLEPESGQYYLHLFLPSQPDLNWRNPAVAAEWDDILRFWLDRGVDGFRVDVAGGLVKDEQLRSNPQLMPIPPQASRWEQWDCFEHLHDVFQPESQEVFRRWRALCDGYGAFLHGETYHLEPRGMDELLPPDGMHGGYWFAPMHIEWAPNAIRDTLRSPSDNLASRLVWAMSSHDMPRAPTRFAPPDSGDRPADTRNGWGAARTLAFNVLTAFLPGTLVLYQGEELGLADGEVDAGDKLDPVGPDDDVAAGRDGCRTPMPWGPGPHNGFSDVQPWLRSTERPHRETAEAQLGDERSWLRAYQGLLEVQRQARPGFAQSGSAIEWTDNGSGHIISYRRGRIAVAANVGDTSHEMRVPAAATELYDSAAACQHPHADVRSPCAGDPSTGTRLLAPASAVVWET
ncbi:alpha-amylase family glycosyl hydrolase [Candidatus Poriferisodalis sp.]|uniref:alpha-amylase family glycosyl hydrolase n=1 Tax=Candidatus Poriferisodalis sp. TaxID=3101277 RepID=UPI003B52D1C7